MALLALGVAGCGELSNEPFLYSTVQGRLTESDPAVAQVAVVGRPELNAPVAADGSFTLSQVPIGRVDLLVLATQERALRVTVRVEPGRPAVVGELQPRQAASLQLRVKAPGLLRVRSGSVSVLGTPLLGLALADEGLLRVGPLPQGCYELQVSVPRFPATKAQACVNEGERQELEVMLPTPLVNQGCASSQECAHGNQCDAQGQCVAQSCSGEPDCPPGLVCRGGQCSPPGRP
jgi:hypothetical protein